MDYQAYLKNTGKYQEPAKDEPKAETKQIDWEQRRYEIAKEMLSYSALKYWRNIYRTGAKEAATLAVEFADALIEELKKTSK